MNSSKHYVLIMPFNLAAFQSFVYLARLISCIFVFALVTSCGQDTGPSVDDSKTIKVGIIYSPQRVFESETMQGIQLLFNSPPDEQCKFSHPIELIIKEVKSTPESTVSATLELINRDMVSVILGPNISQTALPAAELAEKLHIPLLSPHATHSELTKGRKYIYQLSLEQQTQADLLVTYLSGKRKLNKGSIVFAITDEYSRNFAQQFKSSFEANGGELVLFESFVNAKRDIKEIVQRIKKARPDFIFAPNFSDDISVLVEELANQKVKILIVGADSWNILLLAKLNSIEQALVIDSQLLELAHYSKELVSITQSYQQKYDKRMSTSAAKGYDVAAILRHSICQIQNYSTDELLKKLNNFEVYNGLSGEFWGIESNRFKHELYIYQISKEKINILERLNKSSKLSLVKGEAK